MTPREVARTLSRLIRGQLSFREARGVAERAGFESFAELCSVRLGGARSRVRLMRRHLLEQIERYRRGDVSVDQLWAWADELYHVGANGGIRFVPREASLVSTALAVLSVICNRRLFPVRGKRERQLALLRRALIRGGGLRLERILKRAFEDLPAAHLVDRYAERDDDDPLAEPFSAGIDFESPNFDAAGRRGLGQSFAEEDEAGTGPARRAWTDVVMVDRPQAGDGDALADANWVIAFTVYTAASFERHALWRRLESGAQVGEGLDRIPSLERRVPNFAFARYRPRYLHDADGIAEIVLEAEEIGREEVIYAAKLFALVNRIHAVWLDGMPLSTLLIRPGSGRRRRRLAG